MDRFEKIRESRPRNGKQLAELFEIYLRRAFGMTKGAYFFNKKVASRKFGALWDHFRVADLVRAISYYREWGEITGAKHGEGMRPYPSHEHFLKHIRALVSFAVRYERDPEGTRRSMLAERYGVPAQAHVRPAPKPRPTPVPSAAPPISNRYAEARKAVEG